MPDAEAIRSDVKKLVDDEKRYAVWSLSRAYGYVRHPQVFVRLGMDWAASGRPGLALSGLQRALKLATGGDRSRVQQVMADVYLAEDDVVRSEALYREILTKDAKNHAALLGMLRIAMRKGKVEEAVNWLAKAEEADVPRTVLALEEASLQAAAKNLDEARIILEELVELEPESVRAWGLLASVRLAQDDVAGYEGCLRRMRSIKGGAGMVSLMEAERAWRKRDFQSARQHYVDALRARPTSPELLERLLRLDVLQGYEHAAEEHAKRLLALVKDNAFAYYVIGSIQLKRNDLVLAEVSLRKSMALRRSPEVMNDLAWLLVEKGNYEEAEELAREVLDKVPKMAPTRDTLGVIQMRVGKLDEAQKTLEQTVELAPGLMAAYLHLAECHMLKNDKPRVVQLLKQLGKNRHQLSIRDQDKMEEIGRKVGYMPPR